jgi:predicted phosphodiesterase
VARADIDGLRLAVVHETGPSTGRDERMAARYPDVDLLVFGHSHIPWDATASTGMRLLNPGSPTDRRRQPFCTYMIADAAEGKINDVLLHRIEAGRPRAVRG